MRLKNISVKKIKKHEMFLFFGILNASITMLALQILLLILSIYLATLLSQVINYSLGLFLYGKAVFKVKKLSIKVAIRYLLLSIFLWLINFLGISYIVKIGLLENLAAFLMALPIALISYIIQKKIVFKN